MIGAGWSLLSSGRSCCPHTTDIDAASQPMDPLLANAVQAYLATTPSRLHVIQLEDVFGVREQPNLPGTTDSHPNWRRKLPVPVEALAG